MQEFTSSGNTIYLLQRKFVASLPLRKKRLDEAWRQVTLNSTLDTKQELQEQTLRFIGACDSFGYERMSHLLRKIEAEILSGSGMVPTAIEANLWGLNLLISNLQTETVYDTQKTEKGEAPPDKNRELIVVVDSDPEIREELSIHLKLYRYMPVIFSCFTEISDWNNVAAIIASIEAIQSKVDKKIDTPKVPLLAISPNGTFEARLRAVHLGADGFFVKPFNTSSIMDLLDRWDVTSVHEPYRVLLIDDDDLVGQYVSEKLRLAGMLVQHLSDVSQILPPLEEWQPDVLVMDIVTVGIEVVTLIRHQQNYIGLPIIFLSSDKSMELQMLTIEAGGDEFLLKGLHNDYLINVIQYRCSRFRKLRALTECDSLTGLLNHTRIKERLVLEVGRAIREEEPVSMAMIDIDFFKGINDKHGHLVGDQVIKALARLLRERFRSTDAVGRYGGEEFAVIMPGASEQNARETVNSLRSQFQQLVFSTDKENFQVTLSAGIAQYDGEAEASHFNSLADRALYLAKNSGRNCVMGASDLE
jgi:diguanylate cyclase (GGDEF)-like protein